MRGDRDRLRDILDAIAEIEKYAARGHEAYAGDELLQVWIVHHIQIIGEAAANLSQDLRRSYSEMPWHDIIAMRNVLVHRYFGIDLQEVWDTVNTDLPVLKDQVRSILGDMAD
jgi:uncharacterized protein with HEPN domain